jgi:hypothetical protein
MCGTRGRNLVLRKIDIGRKALEAARTVPEAKEIRDQATAVERYLKQKDGAGEACLYAGAAGSS